MLTKKMDLQPKLEMRTPPTTGPVMIPNETTVPIQPQSLASL